MEALSALGPQLAQQWLTFRPFSTGLKPVHVANAVFAGVTGRTYQLELLRKAIRRHSQQGVEEEPADQLLSELGEAWRAGGSHAQKRLNEFRAVLRSLMNTEGTVFGDGHTVFTGTHKSHVTVERQHSGNVLRLVASLCRSRQPDESDDAYRLLTQLLDQRDPIFELARPLIDGHCAGVEIANDEWHPLEARDRRFAQRLDHLARVETIYAGKLESLRRLVTLVCLYLYLRVINRAWDLRDQDTVNTPIVCDMSRNTLRRIVEASRYSFEVAQASTDDLFAEALRRYLREEGFEAAPIRDLREAICRADASYRGKDLSITYQQLFETYLATKSPFESMVLATRDAIKVGTNTDHTKFIRTFGSRLGLLNPGSYKRYAIHPQLFETMTLSVIVPGEQPVPLHEFADRLWNAYGVIFGGGADDYEHLRDFGIAEKVAGDIWGELAVNAEYAVTELVQLGYARRFADGYVALSLRWGLEA